MAMNYNYFALAGIIKEKQTRVKTDTRKAEKMMKNICEAYEIPFELIKSTCRRGDVVYVRQWCIWMALSETAGLPLKRIGELLNRDHTTIIHNRDIMRGYLYSRLDNQYKDDYLNVKKIALHGIEKNNGRPVKRKTYRKNKEEEIKQQYQRPKAVYSNTQWNEN